MVHPPSDESILKWVIGGIGSAGLGIAIWFSAKLEKKVSKDVFEEFKKGNDAQHKVTHDGLKEIKGTQNKFSRS